MTKAEDIYKSEFNLKPDLAERLFQILYCFEMFRTQQVSTGFTRLLAFCISFIISNRNYKSIFLAPVVLSIEPVGFPLANGGEAFWLDDRTCRRR